MERKEIESKILELANNILKDDKEIQIAGILFTLLGAIARNDENKLASYTFKYCEEILKASFTVQNFNNN